MDPQTITIKHLQYWKIVICLGLASFFIFGTLYSFQPILPLLTKSFNISISYASLAMSLSIIGLITGLLITGFLSDRQGRRRFIFLSILVTSIILFLIPVTHSFNLIIIFRFLQGFALAGTAGVALAYMQEEIKPSHFGFAATLYVAFNSIGGMIGRFLIGYLAESYSWEYALNLYGIFGLFTFFIVLLLLPKSTRFIKSKKSINNDLKGFVVHLKSPNLLTLFGLGFMLQMAFTGIWTFLPFYLIGSPYNFSLQLVSYFYFAYIFGVIGAPIAGSLMNQFNLRSIRIVGTVILSIGILTTFIGHIFLIAFGLSLACLGLFIAHSVTSATVPVTATHHKGSASSLYLVAYYLGVSAGTTLLTPLWEYFKWQGIILFTSMTPVIYLMVILYIQKKNKH